MPTIMLLCLCGLFLGAAGFTVAASEKDPTRNETALATALARLNLSQATVQNIELPALPAENFVLNLTLGELPVQVRCSSTSIRSPDFQLHVQGADGITRAVAAPREQNFIGTADGHPGSVVAISFVAGRLRALVDLGTGSLLNSYVPANQLWYIQSLSELDGLAQAAPYVAYRSNAVVTPSGFRCAGGQRPVDAPRFIGDAGAPVPEGSPCNRVGRVAFDADSFFYAANGSDIAATVADIDNVLFWTSLMFSRDAGVFLYNSGTVVRTTQGPLYAQPDIGIMLGEMLREWNTNQTSIGRDIAHLMTGRTDAGLGVAFVSVVCTDAGYGVSASKFSDNLALRVALTSHEIGHNFSCDHCDVEPDCGVMCAGLGGCAGDYSQFSATSIAQIRAHAEAAACLGVAGRIWFGVPPRAVSDVVRSTRQPVTIDVLANDTDTACLPINVLSFDTTSLAGGSVSRSVATGPQGRDQLVYTPPAGGAASDRFEYTIANTENNNSSATVRLRCQTCGCSIADVAGGGPDGQLPDGVVDGSDFVGFINSFSVGDVAVDAAADVAGSGPDGLLADGIIDGSDFIAFINGFSAGC